MPVLSDELRERIRAEFPKYPDKRAVTLPALHIVHDAHREVSPEAIVEIAELLELHPAEVSDTMTFYQFFKEPGSAGPTPRVGLPEHFLHVARRRGVAAAHVRATGRPARPHLGRRAADAGICRVPRRLRRARPACWWMMIVT